MGYPLPGYSRDPFDVRGVAQPFRFVRALTPMAARKLVSCDRLRVGGTLPLRGRVPREQKTLRGHLSVVVAQPLRFVPRTRNHTVVYEGICVLEYLCSIFVTF